jgi:hypothetical protein
MRSNDEYCGITSFQITGDGGMQFLGDRAIYASCCDSKAFL